MSFEQFRSIGDGEEDGYLEVGEDVGVAEGDDEEANDYDNDDDTTVLFSLVHLC